MSNMRVRGVAACLMFCAFAAAIGISSARGPNTLWTKIYGGAGYDEPFSAQQTPDGGYVVAGYTASFGNQGGDDIWLLRTDPSGDTLWTKTYGGPGQDWAWSLGMTSDGGYVMAGHYDWDDMWLLRTDDMGDTLWTRRFDAKRSEEGRSVQQTADGGFIVAGFSGVPWTADYDVYVVKTDGNGDPEWARTYDTGGYEEGHSVQQMTDGNYVVGGLAGVYGTAAFDAYLLKLDAEGDTLWTRTYDNGRGEYGWSLEKTLDGGCMLAGYACEIYPESNPFVLKTNGDGDLIWMKTYYHTLGWLFSIHRAGGDGFLAGGARRQPAGDIAPYLYLMRMDALGDTLWTNTYGMAEETASYTMSAKQIDDGGFIVAGSIGIEGMYNFWLMRLGLEGLANVSDETVQPAETFVRVAPNPFCDECGISFGMGHLGWVNLRICDATGRRVREWEEVRWHPGRVVRWFGEDDLGRELPRGVYFLTYEVGGCRGGRKLTLLD